MSVVLKKEKSYTVEDKLEYFDTAFKMAVNSDCLYRQYGAVLVYQGNIIATGNSDSGCLICIGCDKGNCFRMVEIIPMSKEIYSQSALYMVGLEEDFGEHGLRQYLDSYIPPKSCLEYIKRNKIHDIYIRTKNGIGRYSIKRNL